MLRIEQISGYRKMRIFASFANQLYKKNPYYVPELVHDILNTLNQKKNPAFAFCKSAYFLAYDEKKVVGRIAVLVNLKSNEKWNQNHARFAYFDFIDDITVSKLLLDTAENWAKEQGYDTLHGPLGLTDLDHQGMLIEGFEEDDLYITLYNHPYYPKHMESMGYVKDVDWLEYQVTVPEGPMMLLTKMKERIEKKQAYRLVEFSKKKDILPWAQQVFDLYNEAFAKLYGTSPLTQEQIDMYIQAYFGFVNPDFVKIIVDRNNQLIAFGLTMPSISKAIRKSGGHILPFGFIPILKAIKKNDILDLYLVAVDPQHQGKGANVLLIESILRTSQQYGIRLAETGPELETNKQVQSQWKYFETRQHRKRRVYTKTLS